MLSMWGLLCAPDAKEGRKLLVEFMIGGSFSHNDERNHVAGESFVRRFLRKGGGGSSACSALTRWAR